MLKILLYPVSLMWGTIMFLRRKYYNIKGRTSFDKPTICVGNLCVGGAGKTPHVEYMIRLLSKYYEISTLSRGYGRQTTGFLLGNSRSTVRDIGDEPLAYYKKYPSISVAVCEDRVEGINKILEKLPETDVWELPPVDTESSGAFAFTFTFAFPSTAISDGPST